MYSLGCEYESLLLAWFMTVMDKSASQLGVAGATVGVTSSSSSDLDRKTLEEASCDVVDESSDKGNS